MTPELSTLRDRLIASALHLVASLEAGIDDAPLHQRAAALGAVIDRLIKLDHWMRDAARADAADREGADALAGKVIRIEYVDPDSTVHDTPFWARNHHALDRALSGRGVRASVRQDGSGESDPD